MVTSAARNSDLLEPDKTWKQSMDDGQETCARARAPAPGLWVAPVMELRHLNDIRAPACRILYEGPTVQSQQ